MDTITPAKIVSIGPNMFEATIHGVTMSDVENIKKDIKHRHPRIDDILPMRSYELDNGITSVVRVVMDEEADYQHLCALRAELFSSCA
jgi:hypothetical protein